ncbi:MAG: hypothetical protein WA006_01525 [Rhodoglobus sp.]
MQLTEPQVWVLIGVFATAVFGMLSWQTISFNRNLTAVADRLEAKIDGKIDGLRGEIRGDIADLRTELKGDIASLSSRIDVLDRDVQALSRHVFGTDPR